MLSKIIKSTSMWTLQKQSWIYSLSVYVTAHILRNKSLFTFERFTKFERFTQTRAYGHVRATLGPQEICPNVIFAHVRRPTLGPREICPNVGCKPLLVIRQWKVIDGRRKLVCYLKCAIDSVILFINNRSLSYCYHRLCIKRTLCKILY